MAESLAAAADESNSSEETDEYDVSIQALRPKTKDFISTLLNPPKIILTDNGFPRDWHGLADLIGIGGELIPHLRFDSNPTTKLLQLWYEKDKDCSTIKMLLLYLEDLDRFDIIDDVKVLIDEDIKFYEQTKTIVKCNGPYFDNDINALTWDDQKNIEKGLQLQNYDAFVLFADEDTNFATELIDKLENQYKLKLCIKDRDLIYGVFEHESVIRLISERCARLIAIISPAFLESSSNKFFCSFAQSLGIEQRTRKIIPCLYTPCKVPPELSYYFMLDYQRLGKLTNFWERLRDAIKTSKTAPTMEQSIQRSCSQQIEPVSENANIILLPENASNTLKPKKEGVKFNSMINLKYPEKKTAVDDRNANLDADACIVPLTNTEKKGKLKTGWFKKLLPHKTKCNPNAIIEVPERHKKTLWRNIKRKVAVAN